MRMSIIANDPTLGKTEMSETIGACEPHMGAIYLSFRLLKELEIVQESPCPEVHWQWGPRGVVVVGKHGILKLLVSDTLGPGTSQLC